MSNKSKSENNVLLKTHTVYPQKPNLSVGRLGVIPSSIQWLSCFLTDCMPQCCIKESDNEKADHQSLAEESDYESHSKVPTPKNRHSKKVSPRRKRAQSSDEEEEEEEKTEEEKQQELVSLLKLIN